MKGPSLTKVAALSRARHWFSTLLLGLIAVAGLASIVATGGGGGDDSPDRIIAPPPGGTVTLQAIEVTPTRPSLAKGTSLSLVATGILSDGETRDYTRHTDIVWRSSNPSLAEVSADGHVTAKDAGDVTLTASLFGKLGSTVLSVTPATLSRLEINPRDPSLAKGTKLDLVALGHYSDGSTQDLTTQVAWATADANVATVGSEGVLSALDTGNVTVSATLGVETAQAAVTVSAAELTALAIEPANPSLLVNTWIELEARGLYSDGSTQDLTTQVAWGSNNAGVAIVGNTPETAGTVVALSPGSVIVGAAFGSVSVGTTLTVRTAEPVDIEVSPATATLASGYTQTLTALGHFNDGTTQDISAQVIWKSSAPAVLTVSNAAGSQGLVTALGAGDADISAVLADPVSGNTWEGSASLSVTSAVLESIDIEPGAPRIAKGTRLALRAIGRYSDGSIQDVTGRASWSTVDTAVANIDTAGGLQAADAAGTTNVTALLDGKTGTAALTVTDAHLRVIDVEPHDIVLARGTRLALKAVGGFSDGSLQDLSDQVVWESSWAGVAAVSSAGLLEALAALPDGEPRVRVTASFAGITGTAPTTVIDADLTAIEIAPATLTLAADTEASLIATAVYNDGSNDYRHDATDQVAWRSADETVARVDNGEGRAGRLRAASAGSAEISASLGGLTGNLALTVTDVTLTGLTVTAPDTTLYSGTSRRLTASGGFSDGSSQDLTDQVVWSSSDADLARASNVFETRGRVTAAVGADGPVTITAARPGVSSTLDLTVDHQPQRPVSLMVLAEPNVVADDDSDAVTLTVQVLAADPAAVVADGTVIDVAVSDGQTVLQTLQATTVGGTASLNFTAATAGQLSVQATQPDTGVSHATSVLSTAELKEVVTGIGFTDADAPGGEIQAGGRFGAFVFNTSNRDFPLTRFVLCNGPIDVTTDICDPADILYAVDNPNQASGDLLPGGEKSGLVYTLPSNVQDKGVSANFFLEDPATGDPFFFRITYAKQP